MEFNHAYSASIPDPEEMQRRNYYVYYIVPQTKQVPSLLDSISAVRDYRPSSAGTSENRGGADYFLAEKCHQGRMAIDFVVRQIEERTQLKERHLLEIEEQMSYSKEKIWHLDRWYMGSNRGIDQARSQFQRQLQSLEQESRTVEAAAWRDEAMLMKDFVENWSAYRNLWLTYSFINPK